MLDLQLQSPKEIWEAKKILYESDSATKKTFMVSLVTLVLLLILLIFSLVGTQDSWDCKIDSTTNKKQQYLCTEVRRTINCKTVSGPISSQIYLNFDKNTKASAEKFFNKIHISFQALKKENKKFADIHFQSGIFLSVLLMISSCFDYLAVSTSNTNNFNYCNLRDEFSVEEGITGSMICRFTFYNITIFVEVLSSVALAIIRWKSNLTLVDSL